jgi:hypothetical protein
MLGEVSRRRRGERGLIHFARAVKEGIAQMPLIQGGPPEWIWERTPDVLKWEIVPSRALEGHTVYELRVNCGLGMMRLQFFTEDEIKQLRALIEASLP